MSTEKKVPEFTITREGSSFWVNGKHSCLGRFTAKAWEIYQNQNEPIEVIGTTKTLEVSMKPTNEQSWKNFVQQMKAFHNIDLSGEEYPSEPKSKA